MKPYCNAVKLTKFSLANTYSLPHKHKYTETHVDVLAESQTRGVSRQSEDELRARLCSMTSSSGFPQLQKLNVVLWD